MFPLIAMQLGVRTKTQLNTVLLATQNQMLGIFFFVALVRKVDEITNRCSS